MKKAGSSSSTSKTRRNSKSTSRKKPKAIEAAFGETFAVGHRPASTLSPQDESLFRAFQTNLLSLISHELRTPLTGILNAVSLLEDGLVDGVASVGGLSQAELITMARQNAQRLHRALVTLLDLASIDSGTFHARLRELDLDRLVRARLEEHRAFFKYQGLRLELEERQLSEGLTLLADPQKLSRAVDLCLEVLIPRAEKGSAVYLRISSARVEFTFHLAEESEKHWNDAWSQALTGYHGGVASPSSLFSGAAFSGVMVSERDFLTRVEEGLGSELLLIHEIMRAHVGQFTSEKSGRRVTLSLQFRELSAEDGLRVVLCSRAYAVTSELASVALVLVDVPGGLLVDAFREQVRRILFRASDGVYALPGRRQVALVLDDCKPEDAPKMLARVQKSIGRNLRAAIAHCPADGLDPGSLLELAEARLHDV